MDRYEASVWSTNDAALIQKIKSGNVTLADLQSANATQHGAGTGLREIKCDYEVLGPPIGKCPPNGAKCLNYFAVSILNVIPAQCVNWFMTAAICRNSGARLPTNEEWQVAALGTPDPNPAPNALPPPPPACNVGNFGNNNTLVAPTGFRTNCHSDVGAFDMVGNVAEFVVDWDDLGEKGGLWDKILHIPPNRDTAIVGGAGRWDQNNNNPNDMNNPQPKFYGLPGATLRGGGYLRSSASVGNGAGVYTIDHNGAPSSRGSGVGAGFRCVVRPALP